MIIGAHLSIAKGLIPMLEDGLSIGANTFQFFLRNPRGGKGARWPLEDVKKFNILREEHDFKTLIAHAPYTLNPSSKKPEIRDFAYEIMKDDLEKLSQLPNCYYNFHPGNHMQKGLEMATDEIVLLLNKILKLNFKIPILLETMAGQGTEVGRNFQELKNIIQQVDDNEYLAVCLDTCHVYAAGYDIVNNLEDVFSEFDKLIGLNKLYAVHLNDSVNELKSQKDRHAKIGEGHIGLKAIKEFVSHFSIKTLPIILETPNNLLGYKKEINLLKNK